jgi:Fic family protein
VIGFVVVECLHSTDAKVTGVRTDPPTVDEPLQVFTAATPDHPGLRELDDLVQRYRDLSASGAIASNTLEAIRIELTYHSNAIEGSTLSLRETQLIVEGKSPGGEKDLREIYEARNHDRALRLVENWARDEPTHPLTERQVLEVHAQVLADIEPASAGRFRSGRVLIAGTGYVPPGSHKFDVLILQLLSLANRPGVHPLVQAAELHYNLVAVHPFNDGNGRTARLLMNHHLLRHRYPYAVIDIRQRGEYLAALDEANHGRVKPFVNLVIESTISSARRIVG